MRKVMIPINMHYTQTIVTGYQYDDTFAIYQVHKGKWGIVTQGLIVCFVVKRNQCKDIIAKFAPILTSVYNNNGECGFYDQDERNRAFELYYTLRRDNMIIA